MKIYKMGFEWYIIRGFYKGKYINEHYYYYNRVEVLKMFKIKYNYNG